MDPLNQMLLNQVPKMQNSKQAFVADMDNEDKLYSLVIKTEVGQKLY